MVFSNPEFLFLFLPLALGVAWLVRPTEFYALVLALISLLFYYWGAGWQVLLISFSILFNWRAALEIQKLRDEGSPKLKSLAVVSVIVNLILLGVFKYSYFLYSELFGSWVQSGGVEKYLATIVLPIGISFYTFQAVSYLVDVWRGDIDAQKKLTTFAAYLSFFPQLIAGPIVRYRDVIDQFLKPSFSQAMFAAGVTRFAHGLAKKVIVADSVAPIADAAFSVPLAELSTGDALLGAIAYSIQIYFDFSGYSDMAIGLGMMFGFKFLENFNRPYSASSITDFWRRWHISLSSWFRDYVYFPLGGNRRGTLATYRNLIIVFLVTGFWHGAAFTFIAWGVYHGLFLIFERVALQRLVTQQALRVPLRFVYALPVVIVGWILFRAESIEQFFAMMRAIASPLSANAWQLSDQLVAATNLFTVLPLVLSLLVFLLPASLTFGNKLSALRESRTGYVAVSIYTVVALLVSLTLALTSDFSPFLYFQF